MTAKSVTEIMKQTLSAEATYKNEGLDFEQIYLMQKEHNVVLPKDYIEAIHYSNGFGFGEHYGCRFFPLEEVIDPDETDHNAKEYGYKHIGYCEEDTLFLDCNNDKGNILTSFEGIDSPKSLDMSFSEFIETLADNKYKVFWDE